MLSSTTLTPGQTVSIEASDWPPHDLVQASVCGGGSQSVSPDCDLTHAISLVSADNGVVNATLVVTIPPSPCPCVVMVTHVNPSEVERLPLVIEGAPSGPLPASLREPHSDVTVSHVHVVSQGSWTSWFGAAATRELVLTVHNGSSAPVKPFVVARWVQGSGNYVIVSPRSRPLAGGATAQIVAPFALSTFADGEFPVIGQVTGKGFEVRFASMTSTTPWGLYILATVAAVGILLAAAVFIGRQRRGGTGDVEMVDPTLFREELTAATSQIGVAP